MKKKAKSGLEYEKIVAALHRQFADEAEVIENEMIMGKSGTLRQIDVAIHVTVFGYPLFVVVECKDYKRKQDIGQVDALIGKIDDVRAAQGILMSDSGFTSGAIERAKADGRIQLASVVDVENEKLRSKISFPVIVVLSSLKLPCRIRVHRSWKPSNPNQIAELGNQLYEDWNSGQLYYENGDHERDFIVQDQAGNKITVTFIYTVERTMYLKPVGFDKGKGIYNYETGMLTVPPNQSLIGQKFTIDEVINSWKKITDNEIPKTFVKIELHRNYPLLSTE